MKLTDKRVVMGTWCPRCMAPNGVACKQVRMHQVTEGIPPHTERIMRFKRMQLKKDAK